VRIAPAAPGHPPAVVGRSVIHTSTQGSTFQHELLQDKIHMKLIGMIEELIARSPYEYSKIIAKISTKNMFYQAVTSRA
jgi:hypothetical protein